MKKNNIYIAFSIAILCAGTLLHSCTRNKVDSLGPEYITAPSDFSAANLVVTNPVNFVTGVCNITATFSTRVSYTVTITGRESGATKTYSGIDNKIDANSIGYTWNGSHDGLYFFRTGETADVVVTFLRSNVKLESTTVIQAKRNFFAGNPNLIALGGTNNGYEAAPTNPGNFPLQFSFSEAKNDGRGFSNSEFASVKDVKSLEGLKLFRISGESAQSDGFFVGGIQHRKNNPNSGNSFLLPSTWTDPSQIYFNVYIYGTGSANANVNLEFHESDLSNPNNDYVLPRDTIKKENCTGQNLNSFDHDPCTDDGWTYTVPVNFTGWRLFSFKYSDFARSVSIPNGGSGNNVKEPTRVARIQMGVVANPAKSMTNVMFDFPVISYGAPFDPSK